MNLAVLCGAVSMLLSSTVRLNLTNHSDIMDFKGEQNIIATRELKDFNNHTFELYELDDGYAIYEEIGDNECFIEGSLETNSPYYGTNSDSLYYLGVGNYLVQNGNEFVSLLDGSIVEENLVGENASFTVSDRINSVSKLSTYATNSSNKIDNSYYFEHLSNFPTNYFGTCGLVSISMILGYLDTFENGNFVDNGKTYQGDYFEKVNGDYSHDTKTTITTPLLKTVTSSFKPNVGFTNLISIPGTDMALHDYLYDNYLHTVAGWTSGGFPMADKELKATFEDYINDNVPGLKNSIEINNGALIYNIGNIIKENIDNGNPVIMVLLDYNNATFLFDSHAPVCYGYDGDRFLCHMGWKTSSSNLTYASYYVSNAVINGYFTVNYKGSHVHGYNVKYNGYEYCSCGAKRGL